jgi:hypothetical protein
MCANRDSLRRHDPPSHVGLLSHRFTCPFHDFLIIGSAQGSTARQFDQQHDVAFLGYIPQ